MSGNGLGSLADYNIDDSDGEDNAYRSKLSGNISGSDDEHSGHSQARETSFSPVTKDDEPPKKRRPQVSSLGLVSYGGHEEDSDHEPINSDQENYDDESPTSAQSPLVKAQTKPDETETEVTSSANTVDAETVKALPIPSDEFAVDDVLIPPSPPGRCPKSLIDKIKAMHQQMQYGRFNLDAKIQSSKEFRNPSIYEKLLQHVGIDEKGTNYPPDLFDPSIWGKDSFYDELAKSQNAEMEKRKNDRKDRPKVEFVTATKTEADNSAQKKSKWDAGTQNSQAAPASLGSGGVSSAPPVGSLIKKK